MDVLMQEGSDIIDDARRIGHPLSPNPLAAKGRLRPRTPIGNGTGCRLPAAGTASNLGDGSG